MSGKNRRNNQHRQPESDNTIASVQCDGLVSAVQLKFGHEMGKNRRNLLNENRLSAICVNTLHAVNSSPLHAYTYSHRKCQTDWKPFRLGNQQISSGFFAQ